MSKVKDKSNLDKWLSIITVVMSIIALFFSWQANRLATQQATAQVVALDSIWNGGGYRQTETDQKATCKHIFRLTNLGGAPTAITGYKLIISFGQNEIISESSFASRALPEELTPQINSFEIYLFSSDIQIDVPELLDSQGVLELPYPIEPYDTFDIQTAVNFTYEAVLSLESPSRNDPRYFYYDPMALKEYTPMLLTYTFKTSTGKEISSPSVACWYIK